MNRRSFFSTAGILAAGASFGLFLPKIEEVRWRVAKPLMEAEWIVNPAYANAIYELGVIGLDGKPGHALRYTTNSEGLYVQVPYLIQFGPPRVPHIPVSMATTPYAAGLAV